MKPFIAKKRTYNVRAIQWTGDNHMEVKKFLGNSSYIIGNNDDGYAMGSTVKPNEPVTTFIANKNDYIVQLNKREFYVYTPEKFNKLFEPIRLWSSY